MKWRVFSRDRGLVKSIGIFALRAFKKRSTSREGKARTDESAPTPMDSRKLWGGVLPQDCE